MKNRYLTLVIAFVVFVVTWLFMSAGYFSSKHNCLKSGGAWDVSSKICKKLEVIEKSKSTGVNSTGFIASRPADSGCAWNEVVGVGLKIIAETCDFGGRLFRVVADETVPGFVVQSKIESDAWQVGRKVISVFKKDPTQPIDVLMPLVVKESDGFPKGAICTFEQVAAYPGPGIKRYQLVPAEKTKELYDIEASKGDVVPAPPCGAYGINADSVSYFEVQDSRPDVVLYVDIGQEAPPFDETQIKILP